MCCQKLQDAACVHAQNMHNMHNMFMYTQTRHKPPTSRKLHTPGLGHDQALHMHATMQGTWCLQTLLLHFSRLAEADDSRRRRLSALANELLVLVRPHMGLVSLLCPERFAC